MKNTTQFEQYLRPTEILDIENGSIAEYVESRIRGKQDPLEKAVALYYGVRDDIWYDPYYPFYLPEHYRASNVLKSGRGFCISKASLLCAVGRAAGIPSRVGFATVKNHLATKQLKEFMGTDLFTYHGFTEFFLRGKWVRATPAFNKELCEKHNVAPLGFNGLEDSIFHEFNNHREKFMEYVEYHGVHSDIPVDEIVLAWKKVYGEDRIKDWITRLEETGGISGRNFMDEEVLN